VTAPRTTYRETVAPLTEREAEVVGLLVRGMGSKDIADELGISWKTVDVHIVNAKAKAETTTRAGLVAWALRRGLVERRGDGTGIELDRRKGERRKGK